MLEATSLRIDVGELVRHPATTKQVELEAAVPDLGTVLGRVSGPVHAELSLESILEGILVSGRLEGSYALECARCARSFETAFELSTSEVFVYPGQPEIEEGFVVEGDEVDLEPMIRDAVLLEMPTHPLHDEACKGLCATCGQDLNEADCGHSHAKVDIRWEPLRRLRERD